MGQEEAAEEILKGPWDVCLRCFNAIDAKYRLECCSCYGTSRVLRLSWVKAAEQLGLHEQLSRCSAAVQNAILRQEKLINEQLLQDYVQRANEKAKRMRDDEQRREKEIFQKMQRDYDLGRGR